MDLAVGVGMDWVSAVGESGTARESRFRDVEGDRARDSVERESDGRGDKYVEVARMRDVEGDGEARLLAVSLLLSFAACSFFSTRALTRRLNGPGTPSSSESDQPSPVVKPIPSRSKYGERCRFARGVGVGVANPVVLALGLRTVDDGDKIPARSKRSLLKRGVR
jgi:hypothetical protein